MDLLDIFVHTKQPFQTLVEDVANILDLTPMPIDDNPYMKVKFQGPYEYIRVGTHEFFNDQGLLFDRYKYDIDIKIYNMRDFGDPKQLEAELIRKIFDGLKATGQYSLMVVRNLEVKLDEYQAPSA